MKNLWTKKMFLRNQKVKKKITKTQYICVGKSLLEEKMLKRLKIRISRNSEKSITKRGRKTN